MEQAVQEKGFASRSEFRRLVAQADVDTAERLAAFKRWQREDGTKAGLLALRVQEGESMSKSVGEDFPLEQARVRQIQGYARNIGPAGAFLVAVCEQALRQADAAAMSGDPIAVLAAYKTMREIEG